MSEISVQNGSIEKLSFIQINSITFWVYFGTESKVGKMPK